jgi:PilZ domain
VDTMNRRRSDRVFLSVPITISRTSSTGQKFSDSARTIAVSRHGATVLLRQKLDDVRQVRIRTATADQEAPAQIVGLVGHQADGYVYGIAFHDPDTNPWNIEFPSIAEAEKAVSRLLLECSVCRSRELTYLDELQAEIFEASRSLARRCKQCDTWTVWKLALHGAEDAQPDQKTVSPAGPAPRVRNERKHVRIRLKMKACIRQSGFGEEVVQIENTSRGGFCFFSSNTYFVGSNVEVAVPFTPGAPNIFVSARIIRSRDLPRKTKKEYGVVYVGDREEPSQR